MAQLKTSTIYYMKIKARPRDLCRDLKHSRLYAAPGIFSRGLSCRPSLELSSLDGRQGLHGPAQSTLRHPIGPRPLEVAVECLLIQMLDGLQCPHSLRQCVHLGPHDISLPGLLDH